MQFFQGITDFIFVEDKPEVSDVIFVPGGAYPEAAELAARLYRQGMAPRVLPSGKYSILKGRFELGFPTECDYLCDILRNNGVPGSAVIREDQATFTWENAIFSRKILQKLGIAVERGIICCQAFHARRCLMYYQEQFPDTELFVCPVETRGISRDTWYLTDQGIDTVLGEVERCGSQFHQIMKRREDR